MYITNKGTTHSGFWRMTTDNTYYGYKIGEYYYWYKSRNTIRKHIKGTNKEYHRATKIKGEMYINKSYLKMGTWK